MQTTPCPSSLVTPYISTPLLLLLSFHSSAPHTLMEERISSLPTPPPQPPSQDYTDKSLSTELQLSNINPGTYIVQVPKDQIYRVPPPENARIVEQYRNSPSKGKKKTPCWCFVFIIIVLIAIATVIVSLLGGLFSVVLKPKDPKFSIQDLNVLNSTSHPKYNVTLQVHNPNSKVAISYKEGGDVSLSLRRQQIALGSYPTFYQTPQNSTAFGVTLKGSKVGFPKEVEESMTNDKNKVHVTFSLTIHVPARMKMGLLHSGIVKFDVMCQVTLDTLAKTSHILSQHCQTKRH
ncbi:NDR1/HIN1-like protein 13 [Abrus precatorius]|uniref:NDR1/HIN1-like protein 13 n=1 Tax=Abrus precatorius TaxID=3816 RepID=A0A8B8K8F9_ABRPR|nr:NDR1/HIN1-like protein 13 [Abrus precatorius]